MTPLLPLPPQVSPDTLNAVLHLIPPEGLPAASLECSITYQLYGLDSLVTFTCLIRIMADKCE